MNINEKIEKLLIELSTVLEILNEKHKFSNNNEDKETIRKLIEIHIGYVVFLKELEIEILNDAEKKFTKEFLVNQFSNISKSCKMVKEIKNFSS